MPLRRREPEPDNSAEPVETPVDVEHEWRVRMLTKGGFTPHQARRISALPGVDYRRAVRMLDAGADFKTIYNILA